MRGVCNADLSREPGEPWSGVPPEASTELLMGYLTCSLNRQAWDDPWCSATLSSVVPTRFLQPAMDDATEELYHRVYTVFGDTAGYHQISSVDLLRFYDAAIPTGKKLPYVGTLNGKPYSWFFPVENESAYKSCFMRNERLRQDVLAGIGLYGSALAPRSSARLMQLPRTGSHPGSTTDEDEDALQQLHELDILVSYIIRRVASDPETGGLRRADRKAFHARYADVLRQYGNRWRALHGRE